MDFQRNRWKSILSICGNKCTAREVAKLSPHNLFQQSSVAIHHIVNYSIAGNGFEVFSCAVDFGLLNQPQLHRTHRAFCFRHKVNVFDTSLIESNGPVRVIMAHRSCALKPVRQLHIDRHISIRIKFGGKIPFSGGVINDMVIQMFFCFHCVESKPAFDCRIGKDICAIVVIQNIIGDMLNNRCCFLVVDESCGFDDKLLRVILKLTEYSRLDAL